MNNKNLESKQQSSNLWSESGLSSDIPDEDVFSMSNMANMVSVSSMPSMLNITKRNNSEALHAITDENKARDKK